jgi:hypothetical protein
MTIPAEIGSETLMFRIWNCNMPCAVTEENRFMITFDVHIAPER